MKTNFRFPSGTGCSGRLLHGALHTLAAALLLFAGSACENEDPDVYTPPAPEPLAPLTLVPNMDPRVQNDIEIEEETTGVYRIHTTGEDPYFCTVPFDGNVPADLNVLAFEYQTDRRTDHIQLFFWTEVDGEVIPDVERTIVTTPFEAADTWKEYSVRIRKCREEFFWGEAGNLLRIDFGTVKDADIRLRNLRLREMTDAERAEDAAENENDQNASVYEERLKEYLHASCTRKGDRVEATADKIRITGSYAGEGSFLLYELPPYADITRIETAYQKYATPLTQSPFDVTLDRMASPEGFPYDRLLSQWAVVCRTAEGDRIVSHGRYADEVAALRNLPPVPMRSKKGLGGFYAGDYTSVWTTWASPAPRSTSVRCNSCTCRPQRPAWSNTPTAAKPTISTPKSSMRSTPRSAKPPHATLPSRRSCWSIPPQRRATPNSAPCCNTPTTRGEPTPCPT